MDLSSVELDLDQTERVRRLLRWHPLKTACLDMASVTALPVGSIPDDRFSAYDHPDLANRYLRNQSRESSDENLNEVVIQLENIECAGCCSTVENALAVLPGVRSAEINYTTHQLRVSWNPGQLELSAVLRALDELGFPGQPLSVESRGDTLARQRASLLKRFGVAAAFGMQIMVLSVCLYTGQWWGIEPALAHLFRYLSLLLVLPVLVYSARPFFAAALRALLSGRVSMDVPVSLGLGIAFLASLYSLFTGGHEIYFDSIAMFAFLVLGARLIELNHRLRAVSSVAAYDAVLPVSAKRRGVDGEWRHVPALSLTAGDQISIGTGDVVPADGTILIGRSSFDESLLSGESMPLIKAEGDAVVAGTVNVEHPVVIGVTEAGEQTVISAIARLVRKASFEKPKTSPLVEKLAGWFVFTVLTIAVIVAATGYFTGSSAWLSSTIAVLIVSCPCALALATPAALSVAMGRAQKLGVLVTNASALEQFGKIEHFFFDKTGTLTTGHFEVQSVDLVPRTRNSEKKDMEAALRIVHALESYSKHPVAEALKKYAASNGLRTDSKRGAELAVSGVQSIAGGGITGSIEGTRYHIGTAQFIQSSTDSAFSVRDPEDGTVAILADDTGVICVFTLRDQLREGALSLVKLLKAGNRRLTILSGDQRAAVKRVADEVGIANYHSGCTPDKKLQLVSRCSQEGETTAMLGDGVNDAAVISRADVAVAVGETVNLTTVSADMILLGSRLDGVADTLRLSNRLRAIIRQNLGWALGYNLIAIPFAAVGMVPPWLAAIGMSLSSLVVVLNATRLGQT